MTLYPLVAPDVEVGKAPSPRQIKAKTAAWYAVLKFCTADVSCTTAAVDARSESMLMA